jgi:hypothetical protein
MRDLESVMDVREEGWTETKVDSLEKALEMAMRTISLAAEGVSGRATQLLPLPTDQSELPVKACPIVLPAFLADKNFCSYGGYYHTDFTLPSEYFIPDVERPLGLRVHELDFTYLFDRSIDNPEFITTGEGRQIRQDKPVATEKSRELYARYKKVKGEVETIAIKDSLRLRRALGR